MEKLRPKKLGHLVLMVRDIQRSARFYTEVVGLTVSDWIGDQMVFLRAGEDHHDLALSQIPAGSPGMDDLPHYGRPGVEHFSYLVEDRAEIDRTVEVLKAHGVEIVRGVGKHGPGENLFLVFKDPDGNNVEVYCEMTQIPPGSDYQAKVWERNIESFDQYRFKHFVVPPPQAVVDAKSGGEGA